MAPNHSRQRTKASPAGKTWDVSPAPPTGIFIRHDDSPIRIPGPGVSRPGAAVRILGVRLDGDQSCAGSCIFTCARDRTARIARTVRTTVSAECRESACNPAGRPLGGCERPICRQQIELPPAAEDRARPLHRRMGALVQARGRPHNTSSRQALHCFIQVLPAARSAR
jgi:hypothetical protein